MTNVHITPKMTVKVIQQWLVGEAETVFLNHKGTFCNSISPPPTSLTSTCTGIHEIPVHDSKGLPRAP